MHAKLQPLGQTLSGDRTMLNTTRRGFSRIALALPAFTLLPSGARADDTVKVGATYPLSGGAASAGTAAKQAIEVAVEIINNAITSTISRTIITHGSTEIMVLSMLLFGGPTLFYFALALTIGILFGIYSSVFVAASIAMWLGIKREDLIKGPAKKDEDPNDPNAGATV